MEERIMSMVNVSKVLRLDAVIVVASIVLHIKGVMRINVQQRFSELKWRKR